MKGSFTVKNLLDLSIQIDEDPELAGNMEEIFNYLILNIFFKRAGEEKKMQNFFNDYETPEFFLKHENIRDINPEEVRSFVEAETPNDTFAGKILLSKPYLKVFYQNHQPEFKKLPSEIQMEVIEKIKAKNNEFIYAFEKMKLDMEADKNRTILSLVALIIKNIYLRTGKPLKDHNNSIVNIIKNHIEYADEIFTGKQNTIKDLTDDTKIKAIVKDFFVVRKFDEIVFISDLFKTEVKRFQKRAQIANKDI